MSSNKYGKKKGGNSSKKKGQKKEKALANSAAATSQQSSKQPSKQIGEKKAAQQSHWQSYGLDHIAQRLVLDALSADKDSLNQSHKMRMAVTYGLERFWGEHLRLRNSKKDSDRAKSNYWKATWDEFVAVMKKAGVTIPNKAVDANDAESIKRMSEALWALEIEVQRVSLAVLSQLCDCVVWWTQRYKGVNS